MAGNTKFLGFGTDNQITLERWGKKATAELPGPAIEVLRDLCYHKLPVRPPQQVPRSEISYNDRLGQVELHMTPKQALILASAIGGEVPSHEEFMKEFALLASWEEELREAVREHERYISTQDEPGVPEGGTTEA